MKYDAWEIPNIPAQQRTSAEHGPLLQSLLAVRGICTPEAAHAFLDCGPDVLSDAMQMADMPAARARLQRAIEAKEHIAVYGDYDVDGITAACILTGWLRGKGVETEMYIPDRIGEGYGLNVAAVEHLHAKGVSLLITVDCGIAAIAEVEAAAALGMDVIVTDHHECQSQLPNCVAVVDPRRSDCSGNPTLAGVGVAFKLICAVEGEAAAALEKWADLVAVGTVADVMPLTGENRYIVRVGLQMLADRPRSGMAALLNECGAVKRPLHATAIGFTVAPRLNAAGRLGHAMLAADLLLCEDDAQGCALAKELCVMNRARQRLEQEAWREAVAILEENPPDGPIVLAQDSWHQGVVGIAASRLTDAYALPAILICLDGDRGKGSCRSSGGFNLFEALSACSDLLESYGGHALAAGLTIRRENIPAFRDAICKYYREHPASESKVLPVDLRITDAEYLERDCVQELELLEPCGYGNPRPVCCLTGAVLESLTPVGGGKHLRLRLQKFDRLYSCIYFSQTEETLGLRVGDFVDAAFYPNINEFRGHRQVQLLIEDLRRTEYLPQCRDILHGELPSACDKDLLVPCRADFVGLWKKLEQLGGKVSGELSDTLRKLSGCRYPALTCVCLVIFAQVGLADVVLTESSLEVKQRKSRDKRDLESAPLLQYLRQL